MKKVCIVFFIFLLSCSNNSSEPLITNVGLNSSNESSLSSSSKDSVSGDLAYSNSKSSEKYDSSLVEVNINQDSIKTIEQDSFSSSLQIDTIFDNNSISINKTDTLDRDSLVENLLIGKVIYDEKSLVYKQDFEEFKVGQYDQEAIKKALGVSFCNGADEGRVWIVEDKIKGHVLEAKYPKGQVKTSSSGLHTKIIFDKEYDELYMSYWVYFPDDFDFRAGGKLPGLAYQTDTRNMSLRLMWRYNGLIEYYVHYNTKPDRDDFQASINWSLIDPYSEPNGMPQLDQAKFEKGKWNNVILYYKLNTPGKKDGIMRGWLNGKLSIDITDNGDYRQIGEDDIMLNAIYLSTFFGGTDSSFQPIKDEYAYFDDFIVSTDTIKFILNK